MLTVNRTLVLISYFKRSAIALRLPMLTKTFCSLGNDPRHIVGNAAPDRPYRSIGRFRFQEIAP